MQEDEEEDREKKKPKESSGEYTLYFQLSLINTKIS